MKQVKVGQMPGRIQEFAVETGTSIRELLNEAGLEAAGYDVKVDGNKVDPDTATVNESTNLVLLVRQVKGNNIGETATQSTAGYRTVKVGQMPGRIEEYAVEVGATVQSVIDQAGLNANGFDVKVDGTKVDPNTEVISDRTDLILLVRQVKGNK